MTAPARQPLIDQLARRLLEHPAVERVWLFGSRARGDNFERSDIDLAIEAPAMPDETWVQVGAARSVRRTGRAGWTTKRLG